MMDWLRGLLSAWNISGSSIVWGLVLFVSTSLLGLVAVGIFMVRIPAGYFNDRCPAPLAERRGMRAWAVFLLKNLLGLVVIVIGLAMSLPGVPGPGFLVILAGFMITDFPGKRRLEIWLVSRPGVLDTINTIRRRYGKPPIQLECEPERT